MNQDNLKTAAENYAAGNGADETERSLIEDAFKAGAVWNETDKEINRLVTEIERLDAQRVSDRPKVNADTIGQLHDALQAFEFITGRQYEIKVK